jgi:hypothetical protein
MNRLLAGLKHLNRLEQVLAQSAMRDAPLEAVLMLSSAGQVRCVEVGELARVREAFVTNVRWGVQSIAVLEGRPLSCQTRAQALRRVIDAAQP